MRTPPSRQGPGATPPPSSTASGRRPAQGRRAHAGRPAMEHTGQLPRTAAAMKAPVPEGEAPPSRREYALRRSTRQERPARNENHAFPRPSPSLRHRLRRAGTARAKTVTLLAVPVVSLLAVWGLTAVSTAQATTELRRAHLLDAHIGAPVATAVTTLQAERRAAARQLTSPSDERASALRRKVRHTDEALGRLHSTDARRALMEESTPRDVARRIERFVARTEKLHSLRTAVLGRKAGWEATYERYTTLVAEALDISGALTAVPDAAFDARALLEFARAGEMLAREDTLLSSAHLSKSIATERLRLFTGAAATRRTFTVTAATGLREPQSSTWRLLANRDAHHRLRSAEDRVIDAAAGRSAARAVTAADWDRARTAVGDALRTVENRARRPVDESAGPVPKGLRTPAGAAVFLGPAAVAASAAASVQVGRRLGLTAPGLPGGAPAGARRRPPCAGRPPCTGPEPGIRADAPPRARADAAPRVHANAMPRARAAAPQRPPAGGGGAQGGEKAGTARRAAAGDAVARGGAEEAGPAGAAPEVFVGLARRGQALAHRQLTLLDAMERRAENPEELGDLFRLDHLATRARRHAESLIILSGGTPSRVWRTPVPLVSVVRAAVSEVEGRPRVDVCRLADMSVTGSVVPDVVHLLAELMENAAQFSPSHTRVRVSGETVAGGYALEIEDQGRGMNREASAEANRRLAQPGACALSDGGRIGLLVAGRLAARREIGVRLRPSTGGGVTAVVLLPAALLHEPPSPSRPGKPRSEPVGHTVRPTAAIARPTAEPKAPSEPADLRLPGAQPLPGDDAPAHRARSARPAPPAHETPSHDRPEDLAPGPGTAPQGRARDRTRDRAAAHHEDGARRIGLRDGLAEENGPTGDAVPRVLRSGEEEGCV